MPTNDAPEISVVIPVANEAAALPECLACISRRSSEILVVDAGSDDQSAALARAAGCHVVPAPQRHRARQMNLGAAQARGRILLFLHADTWLPPGALAKIIDAIDRRNEPRVVVRLNAAQQFDQLDVHVNSSGAGDANLVDVDVGWLYHGVVHRRGHCLGRQHRAARRESGPAVRLNLVPQRRVHGTR